jgi:RNA polymerase sigma-70 factor, ECF subfamily
MISDTRDNGSITAAPSSPPADGMLVMAAKRGDMKAFESLYRLHCGKVMGLCLRMTRKHDVAEDCVQQTFIKAWKSLSAFEGRSSFGTWLHSIAVHVVLGQQRSSKPWLTVTETDSSEADAEQLDQPHDDDAGKVMDVERVLNSLPEGARHVVVLQSIYGYSHEEVAKMLGIAVGTCKAQLHRARHLLRERLDLAESRNG